MKFPKSITQTPATITKGSQSVVYLELLTFVGSADRLRIRIESDAYRFQCRARIDRWDGRAWQEVWHIEPGSMLTKEGLCYLPTLASAKEFSADRQVLVDHAAVVLGLVQR